MNSRWTKQGAEEAIRRWGSTHGEGFALRLYSARLIGEDPVLVLHGGGNVSFKCTHRTILGDDIDAIFVKGSGQDLAAIDADSLPGLDLGYLRRLRSLSALSDAEMIKQFRTHLFDASAPTPSIETLLHAFLPHRFIDHSHADAVLALTNQAQGERFIREALEDRVAIVPYVRAGFELAKAAAQCYEAHPGVEGIILLQHGLITFGDDARMAYERHIALVDACERFLEERMGNGARTVARAKARGSGGMSESVSPAELAVRVGPMLRGLLAAPTGDEDQPWRRPILQWRATDEVLHFVNSADARELAEAGPLTGDHLIRTGPWPMFVENPSWHDEAALRRELETALQRFREKYAAYVSDHNPEPRASARANSPSAGAQSSFPTVVLLPGAGIFCAGKTKKEARIAADITEHTLLVKARTRALGPYRGPSPEHLYDMEYRAFQQAKLTPAKPVSNRHYAQPLEGQVVVISGGAGAIGSAVAEVCAEAGAHVAVTDLNKEGLSRVVQRIEDRHGRGLALGVVMDVRDEVSVRAGFAEIVRAFGGVDVVVPNAGIAHVAPIERLALEDFRRVLDVNTIGYLLLMKEGIDILKRQGLGGHIIISASKNVFGPGKEFGAYSASKAAGHQLGKVAAIELAPHGIRVNMINADAIFGDDALPSGLWATVGPQRAKSRNLKAEDLPEHYRTRNLLKARIQGRHVGNAVVFFASNATPTTGATLPVDGGIVEAFPR